MHAYAAVIEHCPDTKLYVLLEDGEPKSLEQRS